MVHENLPAGVIITNGLGGGYQTYILAQYDLFLGVGGSPAPIEVSVRVIGGAGGTAWRPETYLPPRDDSEDELIWKPREDEEFEVVIKARIGTRDIERHYFVKQRTQVVVTQIIKFLNTTTSRISVGVGSIKKTAKEAVVRIRNLGKKS